MFFEKDFFSIYLNSTTDSINLSRIWKSEYLLSLSSALFGCVPSCNRAPTTRPFAGFLESPVAGMGAQWRNWQLHDCMPWLSQRKCNNFRFMRRDGRRRFAVTLNRGEIFFQLTFFQKRSEWETHRENNDAPLFLFSPPPARKTPTDFPSASPAETHCIRTLSIIQAVFLISRRRGRGEYLPRRPTHTFRTSRRWPRAAVEALTSLCLEKPRGLRDNARWSGFVLPYERGKAVYCTIQTPMALSFPGLVQRPSR